MIASIFPLRFVILGRPCSFKNSKQAVRMGGKVSIVPSKRSQRWMKIAVAQLENQWRYVPIPKTVELNAQIVSYLPTRALTDADNLYGGPGDAMQEAGILEDDSCIVAHDGSRRRYDPKRPRVEITLTMFGDGELDLEPDPSKVEIEF